MTDLPNHGPVEAILAQIPAAIRAGEWTTVARLAAAARALAPDHDEALLFAQMASRIGALPEVPWPARPVRSRRIHDVGAPDTKEVAASASRHAHSHVIADILKAVRFAPFSTVATQLLATIDDHSSTLGEMSALAASDPGLSKRVLRAANSRFYADEIRVTSIRDALVVLGASEVRALIVATSLVAAAPVASYINSEAFWRFSLVTGLLANLVAGAQDAHGGDAFTAGMTHNVGLLILDQYCPDGLREVKHLASDESRRLHDRERIIFGFDDAELGARQAEVWGLPPNVVRAIASHGMRHQELSDGELTSSALVRARVYARALGLSDGIEQSASRTPTSGWLTATVERRIEALGGWDGLLLRVDGLLESVTP
jgi:HD-like signal output (HDOD) protein